jgi:protein-S-isoprenylcysteine O-methyltransferase Ste14
VVDAFFWPNETLSQPRSGPACSLGRIAGSYRVFNAVAEQVLGEITGWRVVLSIFLLLFAGLLSWTATRSLGRYWRIDAGLSPDHELVTSGPYRVVRHPIYTSMPCVLLGTGFMLTPLPLLVLSVLVFIVGTEIRVRIEDRLLAARFGDRIRDYQRSAPHTFPW